MQRRIEALQQATSTIDDVCPCGTAALPPLQQAHIVCAQMRAMISLGDTLHTLEGEQSVNLDASRRIVAAYEKKVQAAVAKQELGQKKRSMQIDIDAAHRFISAAIPDLSAQARQDLQQVCWRTDTIGGRRVFVRAQGKAPQRG